MNKALLFSTSLWGALLAGSLQADGVLKPAHGGRMAEVAGHRLELVATEGRVDLYLTDHADRPLAVDKATGKATLLGEKGKVEIPLAPAGGNRLSGQGTAGSGAVILQVEGLDKRLSARLPASQP